MEARYGWDLQSWYGQFVTAAIGAFGLALAVFLTAQLLMLRYDARVASGAIHSPATHALPDSESVLVLGADIGRAPDDANLNALAGALKIAVKDMPWPRALVRRSADTTVPPTQSLFFPVNGIAEAFALCAKLAELPPGCTPSIATSAELSASNGNAVTRRTLASLGVSPYLPEPVPRTKTASLIPPQDAVVQPPVRLHPAAPETALPPDSTIWLSNSYGPNSPGVVRVVAVGDVMMGSRDLGLNPDIRPGVDAARLVGSDLAGIFRGADIAFANLEGPLYDGDDTTPKNCGQCFSFRSPTYYGDVLQSLGVDAVSLANNHSGDYGEAGRDSTIAALRDRSIGFAGLDRDGARSTTVLLPGGRKAAVVAFAPNNGTLNINDVGRAAALVRALKKTHALVIVSFHGGAEGWAYVHVPKTEEIFAGEDRGDVLRFAHAVIDAGADLVLGQGPHVPRAVELYRGRLIAYSLGNFWTYTGVMNYAVSGLGPVLDAWLAPDGSIAGFTIHSSRQAGLGVPHLDPMGEAARYVLYLTKSDFPDSYARIANAERTPAFLASSRGEGGETRILVAPGS